MKKYWKILLVIFIILIIPIFNIYQYISSPPSLVGTSDSGTWKAEYYLEKGNTYWDGKLTRLTKTPVLVSELNLYEAGNRESYGPYPNAQKKYYDFKTLGDKPSRGTEYKVEVKWGDNKGKHEEIFLLKEDKKTLTIKDLISFN
ncbi:hypothetical protein [Niallia nealsonii]|uniref:Uncharacterized protein n=1 Tax=Niallia nealsonii TaxID=115979 RepID=A0A2N0YZB0_9BACI|nr:hypothetical protein [Niallia nealsonii]PKG22606.1 hypothetical protein CWS01_16420 [Niallia nealsonii]